MLDLFHIPTPQKVNFQEFYGGDDTSTANTRTWVKPRGSSMVRFLLIGSGGSGGSGSSTAGAGGGGSGAVTSWIGPAMFVPDVLNVKVGRTGGSVTAIYYYSLNGLKTLLSANGGSTGATSAGGNGGTAMTSNQFGASGIFTSIAGQIGAAGSATGTGQNVAASATTFLSGGAGGAGGAASVGGRVTPNYGYPLASNTPAGGSVKGEDGFFITQPILVGRGGSGGTTFTTFGSGGGIGGIGCGGGGSGEDGNSGGRGGDGAVFIWAW